MQYSLLIYLDMNIYTCIGKKPPFKSVYIDGQSHSFFFICIPISRDSAGELLFPVAVHPINKTCLSFLG